MSLKACYNLFSTQDTHKLPTITNISINRFQLLQSKGLTQLTLNLQEQAYKAIRKKIIYSELAPGTKISEKELEQSLKIGRTPIREALIQLRNQELVYTIPQSGTYISKIDLKAASNARYVRETLERSILAECSAKIDRKGQRALEAILLETDNAAIRRGITDFFQLDSAFHRTCFEIAGREEVWSWIEDHATHFDRFRWLRLKVTELDWQKVADEHQALYDAIINHDLDELSFLTTLHLHMAIDEQEQVMHQFPDFFTENSLIY